MMKCSVSILFSSVFLCVTAILQLPDIHYNVINSTVWSCSYTNAMTIQDLEDHVHLSVLHHNKRKVLFATSQNISHHNLHLCRSVGKLSRYLEQEFAGSANKNKRVRRSLDSFKYFHDLSSMYTWFEELSTNYPSRINLVRSIGQTYNNRDILAVKITQNSDTDTTNKPKVYMQCLLHPREWISGPVCMYIAYMLATADKTNSILTRILNEVEIIMVPIANPDGYELTWTEYPKFRLWRKNLSKRGNIKCVGVDLNRNFNVKWGEYGSSDDPCSETYQGPFANSETEIKAISQFLQDNKPVLGAIDFHSFSQIVVYPYGWTTSSPENEQHLRYFADWVASSASQIGSQYTAVQMGSVYLASGTFGDWMYSREFQQSNTDMYGFKYRPIPLTVELKPLSENIGINGFLVSPEQILPTCEEVFPSVIKFVSLLLENEDSWIRQT